jgi:hypothetical protein
MDFTAPGGEAGHSPPVFLVDRPAQSCVVKRSGSDELHTKEKFVGRTTLNTSRSVEHL